MGNDTVGSIMIGPRDFTEYQKMGALAHLEKLRVAAKRIKMRVERGEDIDDVIEDPPFKSDENGNVYEVLRLLAEEVRDCWDAALDELIGMLSPSESFLNEFIAAWCGSSYRDVIMRKMPGNDKRYIVVGAIQTWGDPPDNETATWLFWRGALLGIFPMLGIE